MKKKSRANLVERRKKFDEKLKNQHSHSAPLEFLAAGVAHEFNNLLGAAHGHAEWALKSKDPQDMVAALEAVVDVCLRSSEITKALQSFAQPKEEKFELTSLTSLIDQLHSLEEAEFKKINLNFISKLQPVEAVINSSEVLEVLINLVRNSLDAFDSEAENAERPEIKIELSLEKNMVRIDYFDNGPGIEKIYHESIFHPFWTSRGVLSNVSQAKLGNSLKSFRGGAGLGLFLSSKIAKEHGGSLSILEKKSRGVHFCLLLSVI